MSRSFLIIPCCILLMVGLAGAAPTGPTPPGGWGKDCTNWIQYSTPWVSEPLCYDYGMGGGGDGWRDCTTGNAVVWPDLDIELWIEMECTFHWDATHVEIHRYADYSDVVIQLAGGSCCNNGQYIITTPPTALGSLDYLPFVEDVIGRTGSTYGTDIPLTWQYSLNGAAWETMADGAGGAKQFVVPLCCNNWVVRIIGDVVFHQEDGYYYLGGPGCFTCPAEPM